MKRKIAAIATAAPLALVLTAGTALATGYAAPAEPGAPAQGQYQDGGGDLACVLLMAPGYGPEETQAEAQAILDEDPSDPNGLDADGDGLACEFSEDAGGEVAFEDGSGYVEDYAQYEGSEAPVEEAPELQEAPTSPAEPAPAPRATVTDEAVPTATAPSGSPSGSPSQLNGQSPAPVARPALRELPATGGAPVFPISGGAGPAGTALVGTALLALAARRRPPGA